MVAVECLVELFSFLDRKCLETVIRLVSQKFGVILSEHFATSTLHVIDAIHVDLHRNFFFINDVNIFATVIHVGYAEKEQIEWEATAPVRRRTRCATRRFERAALPGGGRNFPPRYLRVLSARFNLRLSESLYFADQERVLRDVIATFAPTWADYAPAHVTFDYMREDSNTVGALLHTVSAPALTLHCYDFEVLGTGLRSLFELPAVRDCARLELLYTGRDYHSWSLVMPSSAEWQRSALAWLHSAPRTRSTHRIARRGFDGVPGAQRERVAEVAHRELQINCPEFGMTFAKFERFFGKVATVFMEDTQRRDFKLELNCYEIGTPALLSPPAALANARTGERLRFEKRAIDARAYYRDKFHVTRTPTAA